MKAKNIVTIIMTLALLTVSCDQYPIFFTIANETKPLKPLIEGAPTNMVVFERYYPDPEDPENPEKTKKVPILYVASERLHWYAKGSKGQNKLPQWDSGEYFIWTPPWGKITALAVTSEYLYALCLSGTLSTLCRIGHDSKSVWEPIGPPQNIFYSQIQSIHADPDKPYLFAGIRHADLYPIDPTNIYALFYVGDNSKTLNLLRENTSLLSGAVYQQKTGEEGDEDMYYLSTKGAGIFSVKADATGALESVQPLNNTDLVLMNMIKLEDDTIIAVERYGDGDLHGSLYEIRNGSFAQMKYTSFDYPIFLDKYATGALALWEDRLDSQKRLLVAGIQGELYSATTGSHTYGYVEFKLEENFNTFNISWPRHDASTSSLQSVYDNNQYTSSLGTRPVIHLFQTPKEIDPLMTFFASTQTNGLWSYRERDGKWQWNAEEN